MTKILHPSELVEAAQSAGLTNTNRYKARIERAMSELAAELAEHHGVDVGKANLDVDGFGVPFYPATSDQACPDELDRHDPDGAWGSAEAPAADNVEKTAASG